MASLVEQPIPALFHGVSRQPHHLRAPGQLQECVNHVLSVERGGAEKRFGSEHLAKLTWLNPSKTVQMHAINRDETERYNVIVQDGALHVYDAAGAQRTVNVVGAAAAYIAGDAQDDLVLASVADYTFILNRTKTVAMAATTAPAAPARAVAYIAGARQGTFGVNINGVTFTNNPATAAPSTGTICNEIAAALAAGGWNCTVNGSYLFISHPSGVDFTIQGVEDYAGFVTVWKDRVAVASGLPPRAVDGSVMRVGSATSDAGFFVKFEARPGTFDGIWVETVAPGSHTGFDPATLPHVLIREADGTFTLKAAEWNAKTVGDDETAPPPEFVGKRVADIVFHRGRMGFLADETVYFSRASDLFNFWPDRTTQVTDADPFGLTAGQGGSAAFLRFAVPFQKTLFLTTPTMQFEITGNLLAAGQAALDPTSAYTASPDCRPMTCRDGLFMVAKDGASTALLEYSYVSDNLTATAADVSLHARGYIPGDIRQLVGDSLSGNLVLRSGGAADSLYVYTFFTQGDQAVQTAWHRWDIGGQVRSISQIADMLYVLVKRADGDFLERIPMRRQDDSAFYFPPRLDRRVMVSGTYDAGTGKTTWTLPWTGDAVALQKASHRPEADLVASVSDAPGPTVVTAAGDWSAQPVLFGVPYESWVEFSTLYLRENNLAVVSGRTQVRYLTLLYQDTRSFVSEVLRADGRVEPVDHLVPRIGIIRTLPTGSALATGTERIRVQGRNTETAIRLSNATPFPHLFAGGAWTALFNEVTRQG